MTSDESLVTESAMTSKPNVHPAPYQLALLTELKRNSPTLIWDAEIVFKAKSDENT